MLAVPGLSRRVPPRGVRWRCRRLPIPRRRSTCIRLTCSWSSSSLPRRPRRWRSEPTSIPGCCSFDRVEADVPAAMDALDFDVLRFVLRIVCAMVHGSSPWSCRSLNFFFVAVWSSVSVSRRNIREHAGRQSGIAWRGCGGGYDHEASAERSQRKSGMAAHRCAVPFPGRAAPSVARRGSRGSGNCGSRRVESRGR